jgi:hypothetical protein
LRPARARDPDRDDEAGEEFEHLERRVGGVEDPEALHAGRRGIARDEIEAAAERHDGRRQPRQHQLDRPHVGGEDAREMRSELDGRLSALPVAQSQASARSGARRARKEMSSGGFLTDTGPQ